MSDHDDPPADLFDAVCRLDDIAEWLAQDYRAQAEEIRAISWTLKEFILIRFPDANAGEIE
jgi:hypothetical protein